MRLLMCAIFSLLLHSIFFRNSNIKINAPALVISNQNKTIDLKIRSQVVRKKIIPPLQKELLKKKKPKQKEAVKEKIVKKKTAKKIAKTIPRATKETTTKEITKKETRKKEEDQILTTNNQAYLSKATPRLVNKAEYLSNPPPEYPRQARRRRLEGTVTLLVDLNSAGVVSKIKIKKSSGHSTLDQAALKAVKKWRFNPASINNKQTSSKVIVPVVFKLNS